MECLYFFLSRNETKHFTSGSCLVYTVYIRRVPSVELFQPLQYEGTGKKLASHRSPVAALWRTFAWRLQLKAAGQASPSWHDWPWYETQWV